MAEKPECLIDLGLMQVTPEEGADCVKMLMNDAKQVAGDYHGQNRSEKFRINWPDEYKFASANWKTFVQPVINEYARLLGREDVSEKDKRRIYIARLMWDKLAEGKEKDLRNQMLPGTQQFVGDKYENRKTLERFGKVPNLRAAFLNSVATRH